MYRLVLAAKYIRNRDKLIKKNKQLAIKLHKALVLLVKDPKHPSLKSHKVDARDLGKKWSSWVTGDIRLIWEFSGKNKIVIWILNIGSHSGKTKVYQ